MNKFMIDELLWSACVYAQEQGDSHPPLAPYIMQDKMSGLLNTALMYIDRTDPKSLPGMVNALYTEMEDVPMFLDVSSEELE